jgi:hypothetical protein
MKGNLQNVSSLIKKENEVFLIYKEIQTEAVSHIRLCNQSHLNFLIYEDNFIFFFISVRYITKKRNQGLFIYCEKRCIQIITENMQGEKKS